MGSPSAGQRFRRPWEADFPKPVPDCLFQNTPLEMKKRDCRTAFM
jgi:hypothetical protein